jgi:hypothetical protein
MPFRPTAITYPHPTTGEPVYVLVPFPKALHRVPVFEAGRVTFVDYVRDGDGEDATGTCTDPIPYRRVA